MPPHRNDHKMNVLAKLSRIFLTISLYLTAQILNAQAANVEQLLTRQISTYFSGMGNGDFGTVEKFLAPDYLVIGGDGKLETRAQRVTWLRNNKANLTSITPTQIRVRVYANSAVATGLVTIPADASGPAIEERFTQVWVHRDSMWRMVSGQITIVRK